MSKCDLCDIAEQTHEDYAQREDWKANTVWQNFANQRQAYPTREKPPVEFRGGTDLFL